MKRRGMDAMAPITPPSSAQPNNKKFGLSTLQNWEKIGKRAEIFGV